MVSDHDKWHFLYQKIAKTEKTKNMLNITDITSLVQAFAMGLQAVGANRQYLGSTSVYLSVGGILL